MNSDLLAGGKKNLFTGATNLIQRFPAIYRKVAQILEKKTTTNNRIAKADKINEGQRKKGVDEVFSLMMGH